MCGYIRVGEALVAYLHLHGEALECYTVGEACCVRDSVELKRRVINNINDGCVPFMCSTACCDHIHH